jgi:hypothetical protein
VVCAHLLDGSGRELAMDERYVNACFLQDGCTGSTSTVLSGRDCKHARLAAASFWTNPRITFEWGRIGIEGLECRDYVVLEFKDVFFSLLTHGLGGWISHGG